MVPGGILLEDIFYQPFQISTDVISEIFRARLLTTLLRQELIAPEIVDLFMFWNHHSGLQVHGEQKMNGANGDRIEKIAWYI